MDAELREAIRRGDRLGEIRARLRLGEDPILVGDRMRVTNLPGSPAGVVIKIGTAYDQNLVKIHLDSPKFPLVVTWTGDPQFSRTGWAARRHLKFEGL